MKRSKKKDIQNIESEMEKLYPQKELAYIDYKDNAGDEETADRLFVEFKILRDKWNKLVAKRKVLLEV